MRKFEKNDIVKVSYGIISITGIIVGFWTEKDSHNIEYNGVEVKITESKSSKFEIGKVYMVFDFQLEFLGKHEE